MKAYYEHAGITIYHADCREILPQLEADVLITDPPYGVEFRGKVNRHLKHNDGYASAIRDDSEFIRIVVVPAIEASLQLVKRAAVFTGIKNLFAYPKPVDMGAFFVQYGGGVCPWGFSSLHPVCYYGKDPYLERGLGSRPNSWLVSEIAQPNGHPCPKPIGWMRRLVNRVSWEDERILDPFMGSGTTLEAAKILGRSAIGIELDERYCEIATKRLSQEVFQFTGDGVSSK